MSGSRESAMIDPWRRVADRQDRRRYELFLLAAPVFAEHGFRGATMRALAHACHMSVAGLYHYFGSKNELATYALRSPRTGWDKVYVDPRIDPLVQLRQMLELSLAQLPIYMLSLRILEEIGEPTGASLTSATFRDGEQMIARFVSATAPEMKHEETLELSRHLIAILVGSAISGLDSSPQALWLRVVELLRRVLVPRHISDEHFREVMGGS